MFFFTTFGGEALSLAASIACIQYIRNHDVTGHIAAMGQRLLDGLLSLKSELELDYVNLAGYPFRTLMNFSPTAGNPLEMKTLVQQELLRRGILWAGIHNLCFAHTQEDVDYTLSAYAETLAILKKAVATGNVGSQLKGETVQPVFRKTSNFHVKPRLALERKAG